MVLCGKQDLQIHEPFKFSEISCDKLFTWPNGIGKITKQRKYSKKNLVLYCIVHYRKYDPVLVLKSSHPNMLQSGNISPSNFVKKYQSILVFKAVPDRVAEPCNFTWIRIRLFMLMEPYFMQRYMIPTRSGSTNHHPGEVGKH